MKHNYILKSAIFSLLFTCQAVFAQLPAIDSLRIIPKNPTTNDVVKLIVDATFSTSGCSLTNFNVVPNGNQIGVQLMYTVGLATAICHSTDTISLGKYAAGKYEVRAYLSVSGAIGVPVTDTTSFTVTGGGTVGIDNSSISPVINIYPNPVKDELFIKSDIVIEKVDFYNLLGQKTLSVLAEEITGDKISLEALPTGVYIIEFIDNANQSCFKKIIKK